MQYYYTIVLVCKTYCLCFRNYAPTLFAQAEARKRNCEQVLWLYGEDQQVQNITFNTTRCIKKVIQLWHVIVHYILCYAFTFSIPANTYQITLPIKICFCFALREQFRLVENGLNAWIRLIQCRFLQNL